MHQGGPNSLASRRKQRARDKARYRSDPARRARIVRNSKRLRAIYATDPAYRQWRVLTQRVARRREAIDRYERRIAKCNRELAELGPAVLLAKAAWDQRRPQLVR